MDSSMACPAAVGPSGGNVSARSCGNKHPAKTKHILTNVLPAVLCLVSRVPVASAGIFPYENMELQVNIHSRGVAGGSMSDKLDSLLSYAPLFVLHANTGNHLFFSLWHFITSLLLLTLLCCVSCFPAQRRVHERQCQDSSGSHSCIDT